MLYIIPDYYFDFHCIAERCEDTCCAGWQIVIDKKSLRKYRKVKGTYARELRKRIRWQKRIFCQDKEKRCAFLNENNLCDLYTNLGAKSLCRTCRMYPRHVEEFENVREISLSVSCPEVARILMERETPVHFRTFEKEGEESWDDFDPFLFSILQDAREGMFQILQNRESDISIREKLVLGMAHDIQGRVNRGEMFGCPEVIERYQTKSARKFVRKLWKEEKPSVQERWEMAHKMFRELYELELLREDWDMLLMESEELLYSHGADAYKGISSDFKRWAKEESNIQIQAEQLLVYFIFTYFCGAVYDGRIYAKVQMAVISTFHIYELWKARWIKNEGELTPEEIVELVYRYSREIEHSDKNLERMEKMMLRDRLPWYRG